MTTDNPVRRRKLYCVLGARSLDYAQACIDSLLRHASEPFDLALLTDSASDATGLEAVLVPLATGTPHHVVVHDKQDADLRAAAVYGDYPAIARFREGHPCWRKVTDPVLYATPGEEVIILDPDVYFPNRFAFEPTLPTGILLMWQRPNCLLPEPLVRQAYDRGVAMADHTDIGVCQFRAPLSYAVLENVLATLDTEPYAASMHVESIVWAALAEQIGGGYLDPSAWHCFGNTIASRIARRFGRSGPATLRSIGMRHIKALHAGGVAKRWLTSAEREGVFTGGNAQLAPTPVAAFVRYSRNKFEHKMRNRRIAKALGFYRLFGN